MLEETMDEHRVAHVFWAPRQELRRHGWGEQSTPPIVTWKNIKGKNDKGYLLDTPTYLFIFRYKAPQEDWEGNPANMPCHFSDTGPRGNPPVPPGEWVPALYGENFASLEDMLASDSIGGYGCCAP